MTYREQLTYLIRCNEIALKDPRVVMDRELTNEVLDALIYYYKCLNELNMIEREIDNENN